MPSPAVVAAVVAVGCGLLAWVATGWMRRVAETDSKVLRGPLHVVLAVLFGAGGGMIARDWAEVVSFGLLAIGAALLFTIDLAEERLPDALTHPLYGMLYGGLAVSAFFSGDWARFGRAALAGVLVFTLYLVLALVGPLYLGDVMLSGIIGGFLGWLGCAQVLLGVFAGFALHALLGIGLIIAKRANRRTEIAFGPAMILGAVIGAAFGSVVFPVFS